jgi:hypothetical protein
LIEPHGKLRGFDVIKYGSNLTPAKILPIKYIVGGSSVNELGVIITSEQD